MFNRLQNAFQKYFGISRTEVNGLMLLVLVMFAVMLSPLVYRKYGLKPYSGFVRDSLYLDSLARLIEKEGQEDNHKGARENREVRRFPFDPNTIGYDEMVSLGFDTVVAKRLIKYRSKGGRFGIPEDLRKIYGLPEEFFSDIRPLIGIAAREKDKVYSTGDSRPHAKSGYPAPHLQETYMNSENVDMDIPEPELPVLMIDINHADTSELMKIKGIGPVLSGRIVKYRDLLGGYVHKDQLDEVYGLKDPALTLLKRTIHIDSLFEPEKITINFAGWADLVRHPYIYSELANRIIDARSKYGPFRQDDDLEKIYQVNDSILSRIKPYISY